MTGPTLRRRSARWIVVVLFVVAFLGPWSYDLINVPAEFACDAPFVRLVGDFCGMAYSGASVVLRILQEALFGVSQSQPVQRVVPDGIGRVLMASAALLIVAPLVMLALNREPRIGSTRSWLPLAILVGGLLPLAILLPYATTLPPQTLWGFWLYLVVAGSLIIVEAYRVWSNRPRRVIV